MRDEGGWVKKKKGGRSPEDYFTGGTINGDWVEREQEEAAVDVYVKFRVKRKIGVSWGRYARERTGRSIIVSQTIQDNIYWREKNQLD